MTSTNTISIKNYLLHLQNKICAAIENEDGSKKFMVDEWENPSTSINLNGAGKTCTLSEGAIIEKAGVNFSHVSGKSLPPAATAKRPELNGKSFQALGVSLVIHPRNPYVPTVHMNLRFFISPSSGATRHLLPEGEGLPEKNFPNHWWFGGGFDLTPYYGFEEDCIHWHRTAKAACDPFGTDIYPKYKKWCDEYFYLKHRNEARGIGGLFFDDLNCRDLDQCFAFIQSIGDNFLTAYLPILQRRKNMSYGKRERDFQCYRRGRYVEFNLVYDRGTLFGLQSGGRTESILMSLPPEVKWQYNWQPEPGTPEAELYQKFLVPRNWI